MGKVDVTIRNSASRMNFLDRTVSYFSPSAGLRRLQSRIAQDYLRGSYRKYEGAIQGRRTKGWTTSDTDANQETRFSLSVLRQRSRDLVRNEAWGERAIRSIASNTVGAGILAQAMTADNKKDFVTQSLWEQWAESTECDYSEEQNFYALQNLAMRTIAESGECLVVRKPARSSDGLTVPVQIQVLEPDYLDTSKDEILAKSGNFVIQGVEFDSRGKRVAYWLFEDHPGGGVYGKWPSLTSKRVPASEVLHLRRIDRAGQVRGIVWMAPVILKLKDLADFSDATLVRQKIANLFTAFITDPEGTNFLKTASDDDDDTNDVVLAPGALHFLRTGEHVEFSSPPGAGDFGGFSTAQLRAIASGIGITYEMLTGDYTKSNFSSSRMGRLEFQNNLETWRWHLLIPNFCVPVWKWFQQAAITSGKLEDPSRSVWTPPPKEMVDPTKEVPATISQIRGGLMSLSEGIRRTGFNPQDVFDEIEEDNKVLDAKGLILDTDPRNVMKTGAEQPSTATQPNEGDE